MGSRKNNEVFFLRITPFNWIVALFHSLGGQVSYWRSTLPAPLLSRFSRVAIENDITRDQWLLINDAAFDMWRQKIYPTLCASYSLVERYRDTRIDFSLVLVQHFSQEFERLFQFARSLELIRGDGARIIEPWFVRVMHGSTIAEIAGRCQIVSSASNRLLEAPYEWSFAAGHLIRLARVALRRLFSDALMVKTGAVLWTGVAPQEMPVRDDRLDFAWPSRFAGVPPADIVYFLPLEPSAAQKTYFVHDGRIALGPTEIGRLVSAGQAFRALFTASLATLRALLLDVPAVGPYRALFSARSFLWIDIAEQLKPSSYITTTSYCWPERPEVAALAAKGIATRIWSYSANALVFAHDTPFRDLAVWRTAFLAREFWVWNAAYREWMIRRQVQAEAQQPQFRIAGPLMCGDASWLRKDRNLAKQRLGLDPNSFYLAVFDVPLTGSGHRRTFYGGPRLFVDGYHEAFYRALIDLLGKHPALRLFIKLKRPTSSQWHRFSKAQLELLDEDYELGKAGRVVVVHQDTDPYLPIAACDAALGMPYTSPVLSAVAQGKPGAYFDPLGLARYPSEQTYAHLSIATSEMLDEVVGQWLAGRNTLNLSDVARLLPIPEAGFDIRAAITGEQYDARCDERAQLAAPSPADADG